MTPVGRLLASLVAVAAAAGLLAAGYLLGVADRPTSGPQPSAGDDLAPVATLIERVEEGALDPPAREALVEGALRGVIDELDDPHAEAYGREAFEELGRHLDGTFGGVGVVLSEVDPDDGEGELRVVRVLEGSPAQSAGVGEGWRLERVDGEPVGDRTLEEVVERVRGEAGTTVRLGLRDDDGRLREREVERADVDLPQVHGEMLDGDVLHLGLGAFLGDVPLQVAEELERGLQEGARGVVLDLRGNLGGVLERSVEVADLLLDETVAVQVHEPSGQRDHRTADGGLTDLPVVVLVDASTASAAEILAGSLQERDRAPVVGETTHGKGTVQSVLDLDHGFGARVTTAEYFTGSGRRVEQRGIEPDVEVADPDEQLDAARALLDEQLARGGR